MGDCFNETDDFVWGTKGKATILKNEVTSGEQTWKDRGDKPSLDDVEHVALLDAIKSGQTITHGTPQA